MIRVNRPGVNDAYDRGVAHASPSPTPNPDAMKFTLDTTLPAMLNVTSAHAAVGHRFAEAVFAAGGVAAIFGVDDFITVTRQPGFEWHPIVAAVVAAAASDL
jgi:Scaffold protein Nfu/NifU N terminal